MDSVIAALTEDAWAIAGISVAIVVLFVAGEVFRRVFHAPAEATRKLAHVGGGVVVLTFPWVVHSNYTVALLAASFFGILVAGRFSGVLGSVHAVERRTSGAELYPAAVLGTWVLSGGEPLRFCVPMAVMAAADTGAALVGKRMGTAHFRVMDGQRSLEGSLTFFAIAFAIFLAGLAVDGSGGWPGVLLIALIGATLTTCVEAISVRGADNLFVPWAGWLVLERTLRLGLDEMSTWIWGMLLSFIGLLLGWEFARLQPAGAIASFVFGTLTWALGGPAWFFPLAALGLVLAILHPKRRHIDLEQVAPLAIGGVAFMAGLEYLGSYTAGAAPYLATLSAAGAIALARLRPDAEMSGLRGKLASLPMLVRGAIGAFVPLVPAVFWPVHADVVAATLAAVSPRESLMLELRVHLLVLTSAAIGGAAWVPLRRFPMVGRRVVAVLIAGVAAWGRVQLGWF